MILYLFFLVRSFLEWLYLEFIYWPLREEAFGTYAASLSASDFSVVTLGRALTFFLAIGGPMQIRFILSLWWIGYKICYSFICTRYSAFLMDFSIHSPAVEHLFSVFSLSLSRLHLCPSIVLFHKYTSIVVRDCSLHLSVRRDAFSPSTDWIFIFFSFVGERAWHKAQTQEKLVYFVFPVICARGEGAIFLLLRSLSSTKRYGIGI